MKKVYSRKMWMERGKKKCYSHLEYLEIRAGIRPPQLDADPLKGSKINGGPQVLEVYHTLK